MRPDDAPHARGWLAELALGFERRGSRTVLASRRHEGPLVVQKTLYPEGEEVCHAIVVHPPGGIAGGDRLLLDVHTGAAAHALLTVPGAGKWYRSAGNEAGQALRFDVAGALEWLPQETIVFDGALARLQSDVRLYGDAAWFGWEILCLGRTGSGERFSHGAIRIDNRISRDGRLLWLERAEIGAGGAVLASPAGLGGQPVFGTLCAASILIGAQQVAACRDSQPEQGEGAVTLLPGVLVARYLGESGEAAKRWFVTLWRALRPALFGRDAVEPRIWRT